MSVRASSWAWESSRSTGSAFLVLLALADHAGADGGDCWPSVARLARRCRLDTRTVQRSIERLVELGEVELVAAGGGRARPNRYRLTFATAGVEEATERGDGPVDNLGDEAPGKGGNLPGLPRETLATAPVKGGTTPPEPRENRNYNPPTPDASVGAPVDGDADEHHGQHRRCRACGTNPRSLAERSTPPTPSPQAAAQAIAERHRRRRTGQACPTCEDAGVELLDDGTARPCPRCRAA